MKTHYTFSILMFLMSLSLFAQTPCDQGRYSTELFSNVTVTSNINFGQNTSFSGATTQLDMDIYEPTGDTETARPLIVWAHGGSFIGGSKGDSDITTLANAFAKRGYVCASIEYRLGMWPIDSVNATKAVLRAVQDMKAAVRYFYKDRQTTNTYKIDTNVIIVGGSSAGAITALHMAYLDKTCEIEEYISTATLNSMGGMDGTSGNPGYSSNIHAVVNLAGALASYGWMESGDVPCVSLHGDNDGTVPYGFGQASVSGFNVIHMDGSQMLKARAQAVGVDLSLYTHYGADHAPYAMSSAYMDTTITYVSKYLTDFLGCSESTVIAENTPTGTANLYPLSYCGLGIDNETIGEVSVFPNPSNEFITVQVEREVASLQVYDQVGKLVIELPGSSFTYNIQKSEVGSGSFLLEINYTSGSKQVERIVFN